MPRRILLAPYLTNDELYIRYRQACEPDERSRWRQRSIVTLFRWWLGGPRRIHKRHGLRQLA